MANETTSTSLASLITNKRIKGTYRIYGKKSKKMPKKK